MCPVYGGCHIDKAKEDPHICPGITPCKFLKVSGYKVKKVKLVCVTKMEPEADDDDKVALVPVAATCGATSVQLESTPEE